MQEEIPDVTFTLSTKTLLQSYSIEPLPCDKHHLLVAAMPKTGTTWLSAILGSLPGYRKVDLVPVYDRREQELTFERLLVFHGVNYAAQHHCRYSLATERCLKAFSIKPIITVRNIFDCVVSLKDHLDLGLADPVQRTGPTANVPDAYYDGSDHDRIDFIIDLIVPWYFNFFTGWPDYKGEVVWLAYETLRADPFAAIRNICDYFKLGISDAEIKSSLDGAAKAPTRKNLAKIGRGEAALASAQKDRIKKFASYYPTLDFSPLGL